VRRQVTWQKFGDTGEFQEPCALGELFMQDILWVLLTIAFFVVSIAYVRFCDRVK